MVTIKNAMVMLGHSVLFGENREWRFIGTNKSVLETVCVYNKVAKSTGWPLVDAVLACRGMNTEQVERELEREKTVI